MGLSSEARVLGVGFGFIFIFIFHFLFFSLSLSRLWTRKYQNTTKAMTEPTVVHRRESKVIMNLLCTFRLSMQDIANILIYNWFWFFLYTRACVCSFAQAPECWVTMISSKINFLFITSILKWKYWLSTHLHRNDSICFIDLMKINALCNNLELKWQIQAYNIKPSNKRGTWITHEISHNEFSAQDYRISIFFFTCEKVFISISQAKAFSNFSHFFSLNYIRLFPMSRLKLHIYLTQKKFHRWV